MPGRYLTAKMFRRIVYGVALGVLSIAAIRSYQDLNIARARSDELAGRIRGVEQEIHRLERATEAIRTDPQTMERIARRELGLVREGEVVIVLPPPAAPEAKPELPTDT